MRSRRQNRTPMTFFSFQDIVCCMTGIFVVVCLLLVLELVNRREGEGGPVVASAPAEDPAATVLALEREVEALRRATQEQAQTLTALAASPVLSADELAQRRDALSRLEAAARDAAEAARAATARREALSAELKRLDAQRRDLAAQLAALEARPQTRGKLADLPLPPRAAGGKKALYVECAADALTVGEPTAEGALRSLSRFTGPGAVSAMLGWARGRSAEKECFVLLVRAEGVDQFEPLVAGLEARGFELGWGVCLPETKLFGSP